MRATEFIEQKRDKGQHSTSDLREFVLAYTRDQIPDYQASAWLMAVYLNGLSDVETFALTEAMVDSGETLDLSAIPGIKVDKHSTGGVGDKVTLAVVPILAAAGVPVAKMSGRGLGFTGGTLDKLESIPGYNVNLSKDEIVRQVSSVGACICAQSATLVPADKRLYALRDVTGTVESLPLVASSVMSKKIAGGADAIVLDVKVGRGAFMKSRTDAQALAELLVKIGNAHGRQVHATLTAMDVPLGRTVGNWLEVKEIVSLLKNEPADPRLREEVLHFASIGLGMARAGDRATVDALLSSGRALAKFREIVNAQGGDAIALEQDRSARYVMDVPAPQAGYVTDIDAILIGRAAMRLGAGRQTKDDRIDPLAGIAIEAVVGTRVEVGQPIAKLHTEREELGRQEIVRVTEAFTISDTNVAAPPLMLGEIGSAE